MKHLPNLITLSRIVSAMALIPINSFSWVFYAAYTYCGVSDVLDGFLARTLHCNDESGARLDSVADIIFYSVTAFKIFPALCSKLTPLTWCVIAVTVIIRIISYTAAAIKYRRFASLHTYMNKLTGLLVFTVPYIIFLPFTKLFCLIISVVAMLAAAEELIIHIRTYQYCADRKALFITEEKDK